MKAAIDVGSNATRLLIADPDGVEVLRRSLITRLIEGHRPGQPLGAGGLERTAGALSSYQTLIAQHEATLVRAVSTAPARRASNGDELSALVSGILGAELEILTAEAEARLTFAGVRAGLPGPPGRHLVVDIGGGSTEIIVGTEQPEASVSLDLGSATLAEAELPSDPPRPEELSNAIAIVQEEIDDAIRALPDVERVDGVIGAGGTVATIAAVEIGLPSDPADDVSDPALHGFHLTRPAAEDVFRTLAGEPLQARIHNPGLPRDRAPTIVGGCCVLVGLLRRLATSGLTVSMTDLLDGLVRDGD